MLAKAAHTFFGGSDIERKYDCSGQKLTYKSCTNSGRFQTQLLAHYEDVDYPIFTLEHTGDGLTYIFGSDHKHSSVSKLVLFSVKDYVHKWLGA